MLPPTTVSPPHRRTDNETIAHPQVGSDVKHLSPGDRVVVAFDICGCAERCFFCEKQLYSSCAARCVGVGLLVQGSKELKALDIPPQKKTYSPSLPCPYPPSPHTNQPSNHHSNPSRVQEAVYGQPSGGFFGYSHLTGGWQGGQAEYVRVPAGTHVCVRMCVCMCACACGWLNGAWLGWCVCSGSNRR